MPGDLFSPRNRYCERHVVIASVSEAIQENLYSRKKQYITVGLMKSIMRYKSRILTPGLLRKLAMTGVDRD